MSKRMSKFGNVPQRVDGHFFHSKKEARRYTELKALEQAGVISELELQPQYSIDINGVHVCKVIPDFRYYDEERGSEVVEDVKSMGTRTRLFLIKKRLLKAVLDVEVEEVM